MHANISLSCGSTTDALVGKELRKLGPIAYFGLAKNDTANCKAAFDAPDEPLSYFDSTCFVDGADTDKNKNTWASVEAGTRPWPPGTAATTRRNLQVTENLMDIVDRRELADGDDSDAAGEKTSKGPFNKINAYDE